MKKKVFISLLALFVITAFTYLYVLPSIVSNQKIQNFISEKIEQTTGAEIIIDTPILKTSLRPTVSFSIKNLTIKKENKDIFSLKNLDTNISFSKLYKKTITINKLGLEALYTNIDELLALFPADESKQKQSTQPSLPINIDALNANLFINNCQILASLNTDTKFSLIGKDLHIENKRNPKYVKFDIETNIVKDNQKIKLSLNDNNKFYIKDKKLFIEECPLSINDSKITIRSIASEEKFTISLFSKDFNIADGVSLLESNIFIPNGKELLAETQNIKGAADFYINLNTKGLRGEIDVKNANLNLKSLANMPVKVEQGSIKITPELVTLENFSGFYANKRENHLSLEGTVKDYLKTVDTELVISTIMTDDFTRNYLSKVTGCLITMTGDKPAGTRIEVYSKNTDIDIVYMAKLAAGNDILIEGASLSPTDYDRAIKADMHLKNNILNIESINYYIAQELNKDSKVKPILTLHGNVDIANNSNILDLGFKIPKPLPSEFLNVLIGQKIFRKGTISGELEYDNNGKYPILEGNLVANKVVIPSQRLFIRNGSFNTDNKNLNISSDGKFRRSEYKFTGTIANNMLFPIVIKNLQLDLEHIDIEKLLASFVAEPAQNTNEEKAQEEFLNTADNQAQEDESDTAALVFTPNMLIIERAALNLKSGKFKEILFGNLQATASLDKNGNLKVDSNKFDFAEGISSAKVRCDLSKPTFWVRLGAKDINSDIMATALMNLKREITGKASGLIILETDSSLKLNGEMKFAINNGTIEKVGLVEYALNFVSIFRNPMAMLSPTLVFDIVNVPEGKFDKINGDILIKDNIIKRIKIESTAPQLATLIMGRFDLETRDASLRIYTKFANKNKGITGVLRKLSLNSLANRVSFGSSSVENYYSAELEMLPSLEADEKDCQVYLTTVDGDVERNNFLSSLKKIK